MQVELEEDKPSDAEDGDSAPAVLGQQPGKKTRAQRNKEQRLKDEAQVRTLLSWQPCLL